MENERVILAKKVEGWNLEIGLEKAGEDYLVLVQGGQKPHIGCTVLAVPRPSLTGEGGSATASVINVTGHKDDFICREIAEALCKAVQHTVVCTGGVHIDNIEPGQITRIMEAVKEMIEEMIEASF